MAVVSRFTENKLNVLSGITVALALVPEAIAFAFVAHVSPLLGLYAAFILVAITSLWGGRPGMVSGASGATAIVMAGLVVSHGVAYLLAAVIVMGLLQVLFAIGRLSHLARLIPHPVNLGFINGLAVVIFMAQLEHFKIRGAHGALRWMHGAPLYTMIALVGLTMAIIYVMPRLTRAVPATLSGALAVTILVIAFHIPTVTVGQVAPIAGGLPSFHIPAVPWNWHTLEIVFPYSFVMAANGLVETLLTLNLIDEMTDTRGNPHREALAQGVANIVSGFFGAMGGCAMLGESIINVNNGAIKRLSGVTTAVFLLSFVVFASRYIEQVPIAALVGVMFVVVEKTFEWSSLRFFGKMPHIDVALGILVAVLTIFVNIALAVITGIVIAALVFVWQHGKQLQTTTHTDSYGRKIYELEGALYFGSTAAFVHLFSPREDPGHVIVDFAQARVVDQSALQALDVLMERYHRHGKRLTVRNLSPECQKLLSRAQDLIRFAVEDA